MMKERLIPEPLAIFRRFPIAVLVSLATFVLAVLATAGQIFDQDWIWNHLLASAFGAFTAAIAGHVYAESLGWRKSVNVGLAFVAAAMVGQLSYFAVAYQSTQWLVAAPLILLLIGPYLRSDVSQEEVWTYGLGLGVAALLAGIICLLFGAGLSAMLVAFTHLFDMNDHTNSYSYIWITAACLVAPVYGLSLMPTDYGNEFNIDRRKGGLLEQGISVLLSLVVIPIIGIYAAILYAYAVKIVFGAQLPKNEIGFMAAAFLTGGTACWLISWPWHEGGNLITRLFSRVWYWVFPVPTALLSVAVWQRISGHGMTVDRYVSALVALWASIIFVYFMIRRHSVDIRTILGLLAALVFLGSFGPFGAANVTANSQLQRFADFLERNKIVVNGQVATPKPELTTQIIDEGRSIFASLQDVSAFEPSPWFAPPHMILTRPEILDSRAKALALADDLGISTPSSGVSQPFSFATTQPMDRTWLQSVRQIGPMTLYSGGAGAKSFANVTAKLEPSSLNILVDGKSHQLSAERVANSVLSQRDSSTLEIEVEPGLSVLVMDTGGEVGPVPRLNFITFWLMLSKT